MGTPDGDQPASPGSDAAGNVPASIPPAQAPPPLPVPQQANRRLRLLVRLLAITAFVLVLVRVFVLEPYSIPTGSMRSTILEGDVVLVSKLPYTIRSLRYLPFTHIEIPYITLPGIGHLERGDVVVFYYPQPNGVPLEEGSQFVKRCVAVSGDTIQLFEGRVRVNGVEVPPVYNPDEPERRRRPPIAYSNVVELLRGGDPVIVPFKGFEVPMDSAAARLWQPWIESEGVRMEYRNHIVFLDGLPSTRYMFRRNYFFALGDNASISRDSRYFGFVPYENLIGQVWMIYWSRDPDDGIRWSRIGTWIQ